MSDEKPLSEPSPSPTAQPPSKSPPREPDPRREPLDLERLDLTVEEVEERISPGETNVFDK